MDNSKHKILMVHNYYQIPGGEDTVVANETNLLREHGHDVILYTRDNKEINNMGALRKAGLFFTTIYNIRTARDIKTIIRKEHVDVVHVHNTLNLISPAVYYAAVSCKVPVIQTIHNFRLLCPKATLYRDGHVCEDCIDKGLSCAIKGRCYRDSFLQTLTCVILAKIHRLTGIYKKINYICLTDFNKEKLLEINNYKGKKKLVIDPDKVYVKPNFMPVLKSDRETTAESVENELVSLNRDSVMENIIVPASERKNRFIYAGRLDETKGIMVLLEAWKIYCDKRVVKGRNAGEETACLVICGSGPLDDVSHKYIEDNKLVDIEMSGAVSHDKVMEYLADSKAMIIPTMWYEGFPMSIAESYSVGTPVIGSDIGNVGDIIQEGVTGYKFACGDSNALAQIMLEYDKRNDFDIFNKTFKEYCQKYTGELNYKRFTDIWKQIGL